MRTVVLCGGGRRCCPKVHMDKNEVKIEDDYANEIVMTKEQFEILKEKIESGEIY